jgi:2-methylcitrate dehydratase PrpD
MFNGSRTSSITDCALELRAAHPIDPDRIAEIRVDTMSRFKSLDDPAPTNELGGKFSIPYCVAQVFIGRSREEMLDVAFSEAAFADPRWRPLARAVRIEVDPEFDSDFESYPRKSSSSRITLTLTDGSQVSHRVTGAFGMLGGTPATADDFARKFRQLAADRLPEGNADEIVTLIDTFETQPDVRQLMRLCASRRAAGRG